MVDDPRMKMPFIASLLLSLVACSDEKEASYATFGEAERAGAIERGWLPPFVPHSARQISERHDLDTNAQELTFVLPAAEVGAMLARITPHNRLQGHLAAKAMAESGRVEEVDRDVEAILLCTHSYSGAVVANHRTGLVTYLTPVEWAREHCPGPE